MKALSDRDTIILLITNVSFGCAMQRLVEFWAAVALTIAFCTVLVKLFEIERAIVQQRDER